MSKRSNRSVLEFQVGDVNVVVSPAPLESLGTEGIVDAVVSSDDTMLSMGGGVSRALLRAAGESVREEAARLIPVRLGDVAITSAGRLGARHILHAVTVDWQNRSLPSDRTVRQLAREIFRRCETLGIQRVSLPALATGSAGVPAARAARLTLQALAEHAANSTTLRTVIFSLPNARVRDAFLAELSPLNRWSGIVGSALACRLPFVPRRVVGAAAELALKRLPLALLRSPRLDSPEDATVAGMGSLAGDPRTRPVLGGRYVLLSERGRGGLGVVFRGWDLEVEGQVAIKVLRGNVARQQGAAAMLRREAKIAQQLTHDGIVRVHHFEPGDESAGPYLVMEYVDWDSGDRWLGDAGLGGLPAPSVMSVGVSACEALAYAHGRGVLHLDIKPSNMFVDPAGERARLVDFGLGRLVQTDDRRALLLGLAGTPEYMAPEQRQRGSQVSPATDVYLLAATLWEFLTGHPPEVRAPIPKRLEAARARALGSLKPALDKDPTTRPKNAEELARLLRAVA